jgi:MFS family permease
MCGLIPWTIANGLTPLLPIYATRLGASPSAAGCQLALAYAALAAGTICAGWLSDRLGHRKSLIILCGLVSVPALVLMGQATTIWALSAISTLWFFAAGMAITMVSILAGIRVKESVRGTVFGLLALNSALGSLVGGLAMGPIAEKWGYSAMFLAFSLFSLLGPLTGLLLTDNEVKQARATGAARVQNRPGLGLSFHLLFLAGLATMLAGYLFIMSRSLVMADLGFGTGAITITSAISEVSVLPLPLLLGWLSDRLGRRIFLIIGCLASTVGLLALSGSASLWHFWAASTLVTVSFVTGGVGTALVADLVPKEVLGRGLSLFGTTTWIAGILGCAGAGCALQYLGAILTFFAGALLPLLAIALLIAIRPAWKTSEALGPCARERARSGEPAAGCAAP